MKFAALFTTLAVAAAVSAAAVPGSSARDAGADVLVSDAAASCYNFADPDSGCNDNVCMCGNGKCYKHGPNGGCGAPGKHVTKGHGTCLPACI